MLYAFSLNAAFEKTPTMKNFDGTTVNDNFMYMYFDSVKE